MPYHAISDPQKLQALLDAVLDIESDLEVTGVLCRIVKAACSLTGARYGALGVLDPAGPGLAKFVHVGFDDATAESIGHLPKGAGILGTLIRDPKPLRLRDLASHPDSVGFPTGHPPMCSFLGVPLRVRGQVFGNLYLTDKQDADEFSTQDEQLLVALAAAAGSAVENARLQARMAELTLAADRERIARDLHDTVLQRLFATGLSLQAVLPMTEVAEVRNRIREAVSELDETIRQIRTTIFAWQQPLGAEVGFRARTLQLCSESARALGFDPEVTFAGPLDRLVPPHVAVEALATLREALSNVARHAHATRVEVSLSAGEDGLLLRVRDDGLGPEAAHSGGRGLSDMAERAEAVGGSFAIASGPSGGTELCWSASTTGTSATSAS